MPPRIPVPSCLRASTSTQFGVPFRSFSTSTALHAESAERAKKRIANDPYVVAQRNRKKSANLSRRAELEEARVAGLGDPVRGVSTPLLESFDTGKPVRHVEGSQKISGDHLRLNYAFDKQQVVKRQLRRSQKLAVPLSDIKTEIKTETYPWSGSMQYETADRIGKSAAVIEQQNTQDHARATEAIRRILALENGSSKDRLRVNIARCVKTFGRHNTDEDLPPRAPKLEIEDGVESHPIRPATNAAATSKRIGPDTGSSEVQIAILTAKIKTLADFLESRGKGDKHNKRNLRLLVHRRQKLLQYLRRKERGGPRWQHCIEMLGLTEGTWNGEISL